ncbi:MAG: MATE family efflux transporter [Treponema sp.]|jgi:putative MATE family efflux protein|nr:MATE family efflux transporter [Treponema sp.]
MADGVPDGIAGGTSRSGNAYNLTNGTIIKKLLTLAVPIIASNLMQMAYNLTDMFWLARLGPNAVAASGAAGMYMWLSMGFLLIGRMGTEIGVSQSLGRGDKKTALGYFQNSLALALVTGFLFGAFLLIFRRPCIGFFRFREEQVTRDAVAYLSIVAAFMPVNFAMAVLGGAFTAAGNSRTPFIVMAIGIAANVVLDPLFIQVLGLGVAGAAMATVISQSLVLASVLVGYFCLGVKPFPGFRMFGPVEKSKITQILKWAMPIALENIFFCFLSMVTSRIETAFGASAVAVSRIGSQLESLSWLIGAGFGSSLVVFIGQNYGAGREDRIREVIRISALVLSLWGLFVTAFIWFGGPFVFALFFPDRELLGLGTKYLHILAFCQLSMNVEAVGSGAFKGIGKTIPPSVVIIGTNVLKPLFAWALSRTSLGLYGVWIGVVISANLRGICMNLWYAAENRRRKSNQVSPA